MDVDWAATGAMIAGVGSVLNGLAILVVAWIGRKTIKDIRRETMIEKETAFAEQVLSDAYIALDSLEFELSQARTFIGSEDRSIEYELEHNCNHEYIDELERAKVGIARLHGRRLLESRPVLTKLSQHGARARILFGQMVFHHMEQISHVWINGEFHLKQWGKLEPKPDAAEVYHRWLFSDDWEKILSAARGGLESQLLPYVRS